MLQGLRRWRPQHGWRDFATELVVVVLGVLIALGAQQAVDGWNTRRDVAAFRSALDEELALSLSTYRLRVAQGPCLRRRLAQLDAWQRDWRDGNGPAWHGPIGRPLAANPNFAVWNSGAQGTVAQMPLATRLAYADLYDAFENYHTLNVREVAAWYELFSYDGAERLSLEEVNRLRGLILSAQWTDRSLQLNYQGLVDSAAALGIKPKPIPADVIPARIAATKLCEPVRLEPSA